MAAKKKKFKVTKKQRKLIIAILVPVAAGLGGLGVGIVGTKLVTGHSTPKNLVWAADNKVAIPSDLRQFLNSRNDCKAYRGTGTPTGVGLWGVYQVSHAKFAKIAYGCSWDLSTYIMAVKQGSTWSLIQPTTYFAPFKDGVDPTKGALPFCSVIQQYKIPKDIESFCISADGSAQSNTL